MPLPELDADVGPPELVRQPAGEGVGDHRVALG